jgi:hypothetical protein
MSKSVERRAATRRRTDFLRWDLAILWASAALCDIVRTSSDAHLGGEEETSTTPTPASRRTCAPWRQRALANANPGPPSTGTPELVSRRSSPRCPLPHLSVFASLFSGNDEVDDVDETTWRFSWHRSNVDSSQLFTSLEKWNPEKKTNEI